MNGEITGSDLTRALLERGDKQVWCAVDDESDEQAMMDHDGNDLPPISYHLKMATFIVAAAHLGHMQCQSR